jgi:type I restriction enzyme S subunit
MSEPQEQLVVLEQVAAPGPHNFVDGPFGSEMKSSEYSERGVRLVQLQNIGDGYWIDDNKKFIPLEKFETLKRHGAVPGDIVIAKMADPVARSCILPAVTDQFIVVADCIKLTPDPERFDPRFVSAAINSHKTRREAETKSSGTTRLRINLSALKTVHIWAPQLPKQCQIAHTLDTVDETIAKTEAVIAKLKQVRVGLLHDLLTHGLDEHGQLRDPIAHPEQFQDSPLGRIPTNWSVKALKDCYAVPSRSGLYKQATYYGSGHRMIHMPQMFKDIAVDVADAVRVSVEAQELQRYSLDPGDLLFARRSLNLEGAGLCSIVPALDEPVTFESSIVRIRLDQNTILPSFAVEFLRSELGYLLRRPFIRQVAVSGVSSEDIGHFLVLCPEPDEQGRILTVLDSHDHALCLYEAELRKVVHLKSGLMTDLLTGRVHVPEEIAVAP